MAEKIGAQIVVDYTSGELDVSTRDYKKFREMRRDATIALARDYYAAYIQSCNWTVDGDDPEEKSFIEQVILPMRPMLIRTASLGLFDFGWKIYEKVFDVAKVEFPDGTSRKLEVLTKLKPLLNEPSRVRYKKDSGAFDGCSTTDPYSGAKILIDADHTLFVNFDDDGVGQYGDGKMSRLVGVYDQWNAANKAAARFDEKMAGSFLIIYHPVGNTKVGGVEMPNDAVAAKIIEALRSNGSVAIPVEIGDLVKQVSDSGWKIEFIGATPAQASFVDRLKYLDANKARGATVPERAILEGTYGTKADAGIHTDAALLNMDLTHINITHTINWHVVNQLTRQNYGRENSTQLVHNSATDSRLQLFRDVLTTLLKDPTAGVDIANAIDQSEMLRVLGVPVKDQGDEAVVNRADDAAAPQPVADGGQPASIPGKKTKLSISIAQ